LRREDFVRFAKLSHVIGLAALLSGSLTAGSIARAQTGPPPPPPPPPPLNQNVMYFRGGPGTLATVDAMDFLGFEAGFGGKTVAGAPFSASFSMQTTRVLSDGNRIDRTTSGTIARDGQGRTRRDMTLPAIGPWATATQTAPHVIFISDPVAGTQYILQPDRKFARQMPWPRERRRRQIAPPPGAQVAKDITTTSLGTQTVNGVKAEGTRYTRTIPAGQIGNEKPILISTERWYSPDLQTTVMIKRTDPRAGDTVFQLTNIQRQEPDPSLLKVPSDYTMRKAGPRVGRQFRKWRRQAPPPPGAGPGQLPPPPQD
jgi:hypothetical protein